MSWRIPLFKIYWHEQDIAAVADILRVGANWAIGTHVEEFERGLADYVGTQHAVVFNSGTSALHAVLMAYGVGPGDEVVVPSFTFIATANAALFVGARPVFAEIEDQTYGLDPDDVKKRITPKTKAIMPIHYGGCPCFTDALKHIAEDNGLVLIEDAAEAFGATIHGRKAGSFGDSSILSFCQNKIITTGEGGAVLTDCDDIYERCKLIRSHGRLDRADYFSSVDDPDYVALGYNFRMSNIVAGLGLSQLEKTEEIVEMRRANALYMDRKLSRIEEVAISGTPDGHRHVYQMYTIRLRGRPDMRDELRAWLAEQGIMTKVYFPPVHLTQFYRREFGYRGGELPETEKIASEVLTLPMYPMLTINEMDYIAERIEHFFAGGRRG